jgi:glycosyltransferase involved in cell wall biosynthesis
MSNNSYTLFYPRFPDTEKAQTLCESILDKSVIIYGIDLYGLAFMGNLADMGKEIECFCDPNPLKQSFNYFGRSVISPKQLPERINENTAVVIALLPQAVPNTETVRKELIARGIPDNQIFELEFSENEIVIPVPVNPKSNDIADFDKPLLPETFYKPCAILQTDKVGVFMKVYRASAVYIIRAIRSVLEQSYKNIKLTIAANDCLPETLELLRKFAETDNRIDLIENPHNTWAVWEAETAAVYKNITDRFLSDGEYFCLLDNDDYYKPDFIERTVEIIRREGSDVVEAGAYAYREEGIEGLYSFVMPFCEKSLSGKEGIGQYLSQYGVHNTVMWGKLWTKNAMQLHFDFVTNGGKGSIITPETIWTDDYIYINHLFPQLKKITIIPDNMYFWTRRSASFTGSPDISSCFFSYAILKPYICEYLHDFPEKDPLWDYLIYHMGFYLGVNLLLKQAATKPALKNALLKIKDYADNNFGEAQKVAADRRIDELIEGLL